MSTSLTSDVPGVVLDVQERAARALPARLVAHRDGWWLRRTGGSAWWVSSVLPHRDAAGIELSRRIGSAESFYAGRHTPVRFQISPGACPGGLDRALADLGYRVECHMSLWSAPTTQVIESLRVRRPVRLDRGPTDGWFQTWLAVHGSADTAGEDRDMLRRVSLPSAYASVVGDTGVVAVGRAVLDAGWAGVFGMATLPQARGRGAAAAVLAALARWARERRAAQMYLQVEPGNLAAAGLYRRAGFTQLCRYHYRTADTAPLRGR